MLPKNYFLLALVILAVFTSCDSPKKTAKDYVATIQSAESGEELIPFATTIDLRYLKEVFTVYASFDSTVYRERISKTMIPKTEFSWFYFAHQKGITTDTSAFINLALTKLLEAEKPIFENAKYVEEKEVAARIVKVSYAYTLDDNYSKLVDLIVVDNDEESWKLMIYERFRKMESRKQRISGLINYGNSSYFESIIKEVLK